MPIQQVKNLVNKEVRALNRYQKGEIKPVRTGRDHLDDTLTGLLPGDIVILAGASGCVDNKTEFFNGHKWVPISEYRDQDLVLQYNLDGSSGLVRPLEYIKTPETGFKLIKSKYGVNQCVSAEHKMIYETSKGNLYSKSAKELVENQERAVDGFQGKFYTTFKYEGSFQEDHNLLRLMVATQADASVQSPNYWNPDKNGVAVRIMLKKIRKKERLRTLLNNFYLGYQETDISHWKGKKGYSEFKYYIPHINPKVFPDSWYNLTEECRRIVLDEIKFWDSRIREGNRMFTYYTNNKSNADVIQFIGSSLTYKTSLKEDKHRKNINYVVNFSTRGKVGIGGNSKVEVVEYMDHDGFKYCFRVPSGMLILRREGSINITGNSGKTFELQTLRENIMDFDMNPMSKEYVFLDYSFEMKLFNQVLRGLNKHINKSKKDILLTEFTEEEKALAKRYLDTLRDDRYYIDEVPCTPEVFVKQTREFLTEHVDKERVFIAVDHMALFKNSSDGKKGTIDAAGEAINELKREFNNVIFLLLSQLNRGILGRVKDRDMNAAPNRSDLYQSDTMFHLGDYVIVIQNPHRLGITEYLKVNPNIYGYLSDHFTEPTGASRKVSFHTLGRIFYHVLKVREGEVVFNDIFIEEIALENRELYEQEVIDVTDDPEFNDFSFEEDEDNEKF